VLWRHRGAGSGEDMRDLVMPVFLCVATCTASSSSWLPRLPQVGNQGLQFFSFVCLILRWIHRVCKLAYPLCTFFLWQGSWCKGLICCLGFDLYKKNRAHLLDAGAALLCSTKKDGSLLQLLFVVDRCSCWYTVHASFPSCYERAFPFYFWIKKADEDSRTINSLE
jgi:hypothetical protein